MSACVAFGPNDAFFFNSPNQWTLDLLPRGLIEWFRPTPRVSEVYSMALGANGAYVCAFRTLDGVDQLAHNNLPPALVTWLLNPHTNLIQHNIRTLQIALGPPRPSSTPFFAHDTSTSSATWSTDLPPALLSELNTRFFSPSTGAWVPGLAPSHISLGAGGSYIYISASGAFSWDLRGQNPALETFLTKTQSLKDGKVWLDAYRPGVSIALLGSGMAPSRLPKGTRQAEAMKKLAEDWKAVCQRKKAEWRSVQGSRAGVTGGFAGVGGQRQAQTQVQYWQQQQQQQHQQAQAQLQKMRQINTGMKVAGASLGVANFLASC